MPSTAMAQPRTCSDLIKILCLNKYLFDDHQRDVPRVSKNGQIPEGKLRSMHTLCAPVALELLAGGPVRDSNT